MSDATERAAEQAAGLRALADLVEATPEIDAYYLGSEYSSLNVWAPDNAEEMAAIARAALRHGGRVDKKVDGDLYQVVVSFGPIRASALSTRNRVCERVVVGTETVTETVKDPEALAAVPEVERTVEREIVRWECAPLLAAESGVS